MSDKSAKVIISLIGVAGLILYGYLLFMSDISVENQKYTVLAASIGVLYPLISLTDNEFFIENKWKALGVGFASLCIILFAGYTSKVDTQDGLVWDFVNAITTDGYRYFYFFLLVIANICPLVSKKISVWLSPFTIGIMIPVILASLLLLALVIVGLSLLGAFGKSNSGSNSWSSIFSNTSGTSNSSKEPTKPIQVKGNDNRRYALLEIEYARDEYAARNAISYYKALENLPLDFSSNQISRYLQKKYMLGYDPVIVKTKIKDYRNKDSVDPIAYKI